MSWLLQVLHKQEKVRNVDQGTTVVMYLDPLMLYLGHS